MESLRGSAYQPSHATRLRGLTTALGSLRNFLFAIVTQEGVARMELCITTLAKSARHPAKTDGHLVRDQTGVRTPARMRKFVDALPNLATLLSLFAAFAAAGFADDNNFGF